MVWLIRENLDNGKTFFSEPDDTGVHAGYNSKSIVPPIKPKKMLMCQKETSPNLGLNILLRVDEGNCSVLLMVSRLFDGVCRGLCSLNQSPFLQPSTIYTFWNYSILDMQALQVASGHHMCNLFVSPLTAAIKASEMLVAPRISECFGLGLL